MTPAPSSLQKQDSSAVRNKVLNRSRCSFQGAVTIRRQTTRPLANSILSSIAIYPSTKSTIVNMKLTSLFTMAHSPLDTPHLRWAFFKPNQTTLSRAMLSNTLLGGKPPTPHTHLAVWSYFIFWRVAIFDESTFDDLTPYLCFWQVDFWPVGFWPVGYWRVDVAQYGFKTRLKGWNI